MFLLEPLQSASEPFGYLEDNLMETYCLASDNADVIRTRKSHVDDLNS